MILITVKRYLLHIHTRIIRVSEFKTPILVTGIEYKPLIVDVLKRIAGNIRGLNTAYGIITPAIPSVSGAAYKAGDRVYFFVFDDGHGAILAAF
jgi:hypothetical protein